MIPHETTDRPASHDAPMPGDPRKEWSGPGPRPAGRMWVPRSRGALSGLLLVLLGAWGALIPLIGPYFAFGFTPDRAWTWTSGRGWLEVLPGVVTAVGGVLLLVSRHRAVAGFGAWLAALGGAWFVVGPELAAPLHTGDPGTPTATGAWSAALQQLAYFEGLGIVIVFVAAASLGRLSVHSHRDAERAARRAPAGALSAPAETGTPAQH
ncbi:hypothetical protein GCM10023094_34050 [Rhodococcus olei]|uniref:Secreted protein n=1 Tax=Rhodococcus olei TaxID=2161675 RepID=A0ABP8P708_9NOCA